jgi:hypothetical protein
MFQLLVSHAVPCALSCVEACCQNRPPSAVAALASRRLTAVFLGCFVFLNLAAYRSTGRTAYPVKSNFWLMLSLVVGVWLHSRVAASGPSKVGVLWQKLLLPPLLFCSLFVVVGCFGLVMHFGLRKLVLPGLVAAN